MGVNYLGGAEVADLEIFTEQELISLAPSIANKISIEQIENIDNTQGTIKNLMAGFNILPGTGEYILNSHDSIERVKDYKINLPKLQLDISYCILVCR